MDCTRIFHSVTVCFVFPCFFRFLLTIKRNSFRLPFILLRYTLNHGIQTHSHCLSTYFPEIGTMKGTLREKQSHWEKLLHHMGSGGPPSATPTPTPTPALLPRNSPTSQHGTAQSHDPHQQLPHTPLAKKGEYNAPTCENEEELIRQQLRRDILQRQGRTKDRIMIPAQSPQVDSPPPPVQMEIDSVAKARGTATESVADKNVTSNAQENAQGLGVGGLQEHLKMTAEALSPHSVKVEDQDEEWCLGCWGSMILLLMSLGEALCII